MIVSICPGATGGWMFEHLCLAVLPVDDRDGLGVLERALLEALDPPVNLDGMQRTPLRIALGTARSRLLGL